MTSPSRVTSKARGVVFGASFRREVENSVSKTATCVTLNSSAPPAIMASCLPPAIASYASPIAREPDVQAVPVGKRRPVVPKWTERFTAHVWGIMRM